MKDKSKNSKFHINSTKNIPKQNQTHMIYLQPESQRNELSRKIDMRKGACWVDKLPYLWLIHGEGLRSSWLAFTFS